MSLAGWCSGKFSAVKLCQSSSISGPSLILKPIREKMSIIRFLTSEIGCRPPTKKGSPGRVLSTNFALLFLSFSKVCLSSFTFSCAVFFNSLTANPYAFFSATGTDLKAPNNSLSTPFLPKNFTRNASTSDRLSVENSLASLISPFM